MQNFARIPVMLFVSIWLSGCLSQSELTGANNEPLDEPLSDGSSVNANTDTTTNNQSAITLEDDTLVAPDAPSLSIQAGPGALEFLWEDKHNDTSASITTISLYQYDYRTELEVAVDATIAPTDTSYVHKITAHQLAWDSSSYRVEICTQDDCLSSVRVPVKDLLSNAVDPITATDSQSAHSFGDHVALNATGNIAVATSPANARALVYFHIAERWFQASTLTSDQFTNQSNATMRVAVSASGDTIAIASIASNARPQVVVFDRLGENWIETSSVNLITANNVTQSWYPDTLALALSEDGNRLAIGAISPNQSPNNSANTNNRVMIFDRGAINWVSTTNLNIPAQHTRMPAFSTSAALDRVFVLSAMTESLYLHEYAIGNNGWNVAAPQFIDTINPTVDNIVVSSANGMQVVVAGWESESNSRFSAVAWRFQKSADSWVVSDSVKLPPVALTAATLRLAADASLSSIAIGWQAAGSANLAFYNQNQTRWHHLFSVPEAFNLNRDLPLVQSVAISADNSTALIGTSDTGNGGVVSAFR